MPASDAMTIETADVTWREIPGEDVSIKLFVLTCPTCGDRMEIKMPDDADVCGCGYHWTVTLTARGERK